MNPYLITMIVVPAVLSGIASFIKTPIIKWILLVIATVVFWAILQKYVDLAYTHPFNPSDGGPRSFAYILGWLYGLIIVIIPTYWISKAIQWLVKKKK